MADREKVVKGLEHHLKELSVGKTCFECPYYGDSPCEICLIADALALLKEQEPVEPSVDVDTYVCPNCGQRLEHQGMLGDNVIFNELYNFCPACGRAVKWDG